MGTDEIVDIRLVVRDSQLVEIAINNSGDREWALNAWPDKIEVRLPKDVTFDLHRVLEALDKDEVIWNQ